MTAWATRPPETAALLNPALLALLCAGLAHGWSDETDQALPLILAPAGCALLLHTRTRDALPTTRVTRIGPWVERHGRERLEMSDLARAIAPRVREGVRFGLRARVLIAEAPGVRGRASRRLPEQASAETTEILTRSRWVGRWLADGGDPMTVLSLLGVLR